MPGNFTTTPEKETQEVHFERSGSLGSIRYLAGEPAQPSMNGVTDQRLQFATERADQTRHLS